MSDAAHPAPSGWWAIFRGWPRPARWAAYVAMLVVLCLVAGLVAAVVLVRRPFPQTDGEIAIPGLVGTVEVVRDANGIPQVYADTTEDLMLAQGYVHAQDRFFEMDVRRHVTAGRLSELFGETTLETDKYIRTMGWRRVAQRELKLLSAETRDAMTAYSEGVNAYLDDRSPSEMSVEYAVLAAGGLDYAPEDWTPVDSLAWLKAMAWDLRGNMTEEIDRAMLSVDRTAAEIADLYPDYPYDRHRPIVAEGAVVDDVFEQDASSTGGSRKPARPTYDAGMVAALAELEDGLDDLPELLGRGDGIGSNSWVVDGEHTSTGKPLLANDPHLGVSVPGIWYQMGLHCRELSEACPIDSSGFTFSGVPGVVIGHNRDIAWGFSNLSPDVTDLFLEKVDGNSYRYAGRDRRLRVRTETIKVEGAEDVELTVRSTRHGPLVSDVSEELRAVGASARPRSPSGQDYEVALQWTALEPSPTADAILGLNKAANWDDFRAAAADFAVPSQNLVYADTEGHIGYQAPGRVPIRKSGSDGSYPSAGWRPENDWTGDYVAFDALPSVLDPKEGYVATANQAVIGRSYPFYLTDSWDYGYRSQRIADRLVAEGELSVDEMAELQGDTWNAMAPRLVPVLLDIEMGTRYYRGGQGLLRDWDFTQPADSSAAAYYNAVWRHLLALTFHDDLGETSRPDGGSRWFEVVRGLLAKPGSPWWDNVDTATVETRDDVLRAAMEDARDELVQRQTLDPNEWEWGHIHRLDLEHQTLGTSGIGAIEALVNRGGYEVGGGSSIVNATSWTAPDGYGVTAAPSMRMVVSMGDLDDSRWVNLTGVSGHAFHPNYVDQTELWAVGQTLPWRFSREDIDTAQQNTLTLVPIAGG